MRRRSADPAPLGLNDERYRALIDLLPVGVYTCDARSGCITFYNAHALALWGRTPRLRDTDERFCGSFRLWRGDGTALAHEATPMALALRDGVAFRNHEVVIERPDGNRITVLVNIDPIRDRAGHLVAAISVFHDTTALKRAEDARARLAAIVASSDDAIIGTDLDGIVTDWNAGAERLYGYEASQAIGQPVTILLPAGRDDEEPGILARIRQGGHLEHYETVRRRQDGTPVDVSLTVSPIVDARGRVIGASKIARDVTERKQAIARSALEQEAMARLCEIGNRCVRAGVRFVDCLEEVLDAAIWMTGADRGNVQLRDRDSGTLRIVAQRGFAQPFLDFFTAVSRDDVSTCGVSLRAAERVVIDDVAASPLLAAAPARAVLLAAGVRAVQSTPLVASTGAILGIISTHFVRPYRPSEQVCRLLDVLARQAADYVERKRAEEQREALLAAAERARTEAEAASRAKDEFLAMLGHELRNPLSAVRNAVAAAALDETSRPRALGIARRQADQLGRIVDDLLDVARITQGRIRLRRERVLLADVLERAAEGARPLMEERGHSLSVLLPREPCHVEGDAARLAQAVANLLSNAAKYTDPGGAVTLAGERDGAHAVVRVRDDGAGIAPELLPHVFDLFAQGRQSLDRSLGGLGIGLTLVRRIVELHGGGVEAHSAGAEKGSEFVLRLPVLPPASDVVGTGREPPRRVPARQRSARVLMVEDNPDAAESLLMILELLGHHVRVVHEGEAALAAARANVPDVMLVDIGLPGMDGYEVARAVRRDATLERVALVALTGYGRPHDHTQAVAAGFDYHLVKPVDLDVLGDLVARLGSTPRSGAPSEARY